MKKHSLLIHGMAFILCLSILYGPDKIQAQKTSLVRVHENVRETPYPQKEHQVYINPTPLLVPKSMKTEALIQFELSNDSTFPAGKTMTDTPKPWLMFNPHRILKKGTWYWRVRSVTDKGEKKAWSPVWKFQISGEEPQFVTPSFQAFFQNLPKGYPRLYCFLEKDLKTAPQRIASHPEYKDMTSRAATAMKSNFDTDPNVYRYIRKYNPYVAWLQTAWLLTRDTQYAQKMVSYTRHLLRTKPDKALWKDDFYSGELIESLLYAYDSCHDMFTPQELQQMEQMIFEVAKGHHMVQRSGNEETHIFNNHYWQHCFRQMLQIGLMFADRNETAREMLEYCYEVWTARAPASGFNRDGEWHNGTGYFTANTHTLYYIPSLFSYLTGTDFLKHPWYQNAGKALLYTFPVGTMSAGFGDGNERQPVPDRQRLAFADFLARETGNPYAAWYVNHCQRDLRRDFELRLYRMARSEKTYSDNKQLPEDRGNALWLEDIGEVVAHSALQNTNRNLFLSFRSSPFGSGSHTLADQNSFNLHFRGVPVYRSTGYYLNFSDAHNLMSYRHTRAHNSILVDGIGQPFTTRAYGKITRMLNGETITYAVGDASNAYCGVSEYPMWIENFKKAGITQTPENGFGETPLTKYRRQMIMLYPDIVLIYDELEASRPVRWDWLLHSPVQFGIDKNVFTSHVETGVAIAQMFSDATFEVSQTDQFVVPPGEGYPNQWHLTAAFSNNSACRILTVVQIKNSEEEALPVTRDGCCVTCGDWTIYVNLDPSSAECLQVTNASVPVVYSYGSDNVHTDSGVYLRQFRGSSVLYDEIDGQYQVVEQIDRSPMSSRRG